MIIYMADEKKDIFANAHFTFHLKKTKGGVVFSFANVNRISLFKIDNPIFVFFSPP